MDKLGNTLSKTLQSKNSGNKPEPEPLFCVFCRSEQGFRPVELFNRVATWLTPDRCTCPGALQAWAKIDEQERLRKEARLEKERQRLIEKLYGQCRLPERFMTRTFENFIIESDNRAAYEISLRYAQNFIEGKTVTGLFYGGTVGTGKTHLAAAITHHLLNQGVGVLFGTVTQMLGNIRRTYDEYSRENEYDILQRYIRVPLLVIDEWGKEKPSEWVQEKFFEIVNSRYEDNKPIIVTTNTEIDVLKDRYDFAGEALVSRIREMCEGVVMVGRDRRVS